MGKLNSFTFITLDGYYKGQHEDISWHSKGGEEADFSAENLKSENILLFGRKTYDMMASFWPSPMAMEAFPQVAPGMNRAEKYVISRTLDQAAWENTSIIKGNMPEQIKQLKTTATKDITLLGSGQILAQLAVAGLIDEFSIMIDPVAIGHGKSIFQDLQEHLKLELINHRIFKSGVILLGYKPK